MKKRGLASPPSSSSAEVDENAKSKRFRGSVDKCRVNGLIVYTRTRKSKSGVAVEARDNSKIGTPRSSEELRIEDSVSERKKGRGVKSDSIEDKSICEFEVGKEQDCSLRRIVSDENVGEVEPNCEVRDPMCVQKVVEEGQWRDFDKSRLVDVVVEDKVQENDLGAEETLSLLNDCSDVEFVLPEKAGRHFIERAFKVEVEVIGSPDGGLEAGGHSSTSNLEEEAVDENGASTSSKKNLELKMSKKIVLDKIPTTVRELFETGLLEGVPVIYMGGKQAFRLRGTIKDAGILCWCSLCRGCNVIPHSQFEIHACKTYKRAAQYICFENGKSLLEVLKVCRDIPLHMLEATIHSAINYSSTKKYFTCKRCKGSFAVSTLANIGPLCDSCMKTKEIQASNIFELTKINRSSEEVLESYAPGKTPDITIQNKRQKTTVEISKPLLVPKSSRFAAVGISAQYKSELKTKLRSAKQVVITKSFKVASLPIPSKKKTQWKITKKDQRLHRLVFEKGGLPDGTEVAYYARGKKLLEGYKKGYGIFCLCCSAEISPSQFEVHAGWASRKKPYSYIYTSNGVSLHELAISLSKGRKYSAKDNDDLCIICADGGDLVLCDGCPRAFHKECAFLSSVPRGKWYCKYCENMLKRERFVEHNANAVAAGRIEGVDPIEQITKRCIRIVKNVEAELSGCALCRAHDFSRSGFGPRTIIICDQCEKEYHVGCLREHKIAKLKEIPQGKWFCCASCKRIHSTLCKLLVRGVEKIPESLLTVVKKKFDDKGLDYGNGFDVRWRLVNGHVGTPETRLLLSQALDIFHECFDPIVDKVTGRDLIPSMVNGRNVRGQEFGGMYCAVLLLGSSVVSAVLLRVFGQEAAELPLVATRKVENGKGFFQLLFSCIEKLLAFMNVKNIVLPAAEEAESIWTQKFGFKKLTAEEVINLRRKCWQMVTFKGTCMLQKEVNGRRNSCRATELVDMSSSV